MPCTVAQRTRARRAAAAIRDESAGRYVDVLPPAVDPEGRWALDIAIERPDGPGLPPSVSRAVGTHDLWLATAGSQGPHWQPVAILV